MVEASGTIQPSGGGSRETDCEERAALERSGRVREPEEATESIFGAFAVANAQLVLHPDDVVDG